MVITYPESLPITSYREEILDSLSNNQVIVVEGDTGSGKTTQIPKFCYEFLGENTKLIGCTQPRRIAASSVSERVQEELGPLGNIVGYKIRFHDHTTRDTKIKFMTDGVLLAETKSDPKLRKYDLIILDEAHERSLNIDFLLGYLKKVLVERPELKLIITSATIDTLSFSKHFDNAPVISVEGRTYPVEVRYAPPVETEEESLNYLEHCITSIVEFKRTVPPGDMLVFLPTEKDIRQCSEALSTLIDDAVVLPMFGRLQGGDQKRIFKSYNKPKIVVSTNVSETSITVPGIRYVVDTGLARISQYNVRAKTTSLPITRVSQASCNQRKGRCGRIGPGICLRLYSEDDYASRDEFTKPEITRANLANVILQMYSLKLGSPLDFPFVEAPLPRTVRDGEKLLTELGAINQKNQLTDSGKIMAELPIDPCISRIILEASTQGCLKEIQIIATALAIQDPRVRPADKEKEADKAHEKFNHQHSDFLSLINIWNELHDDSERKHSWSKLKKFCKTYFLSFQRIREWVDLHEQLDRILKKRKEFVPNSEPASYEAIHIALTSGFLRNVAKKSKDKLYQGAGNLELMVFPGSHQFSKSGQWILAATFLETNRLYALTVATIEPAWLEITGKHLCSYSSSNPRWNKKIGQVVADEKVTLFGLIIVASRKVNFGKQIKQREEARNIFIQSALLEGDIFGNYPFLKHNLALVSKWQDAENRIRKKDILMDDIHLHTFYQQKLPSSVYNRQTLNQFLKKSDSNSSMLKMSEIDILAREPDTNELGNFPPTITVGSMVFNLSYQFEPGAENDGMTVKIPVNLASSIKPEIFDWLVPGFLTQKIHLLLKGLPKSIRRHMVPLNVTVDRILDDINQTGTFFFTTLEKTIFKFFKLSIKRTDWPTNLPLHLHPRFELFDDLGKIVSSGRDLVILASAQNNKPQTSSTISPKKEQQQLIKSFKNQVISNWSFSGLEKEIYLYNSNNEINGILYPYLTPVPEQGGVKVQFTEDLSKAEYANNIGMVCLYRMQFSQQYKALKKYCSTGLTGPSSTWLFRGYSNKNILVNVFIDFILSHVFSCDQGQIHSEGDYINNLAFIQKDGFYKTCQTSFDTIMARIRLRNEVANHIQKYTDLEKKQNSFRSNQYDNYLSLLHQILPDNFLTRVSFQDVIECDRLLQSLKIRIERAHSNPSKDKEKESALAPYIDQINMLGSQNHERSDEGKNLVHKYIKMVDEYRITLFTPEIKTRNKVSPKILKKLWQELQHTH